MRKSIAVRAILSAAFLSLVLIACAPAPHATDPVSVTRALFDAINRGQVDAIPKLFSADSEFISSFGQPKGVEKIQNFMKTTVIGLKTQIEVKELKADGDNLTGTFSMTNAHLKDNFPNGIPLFRVIALIQAGKIKTMTWTTSQ